MWMNIKKYAIPNKGQFLLGYYENIEENHHAIAYFEFTEVTLVRWIYDLDGKSKLVDSRTGLFVEDFELRAATHWMLVPYKFAN